MIRNVGTYLPFLERLVVVNNSTAPSAVVEALRKMPKVDVIDMGGNRGIAAALNAGCNGLVDAGCDVALTMDQDSAFPLSQADDILACVKSRMNDYAIVGLNYGLQVETGQMDAVTEVDYWITSGNFLSLEAFRAVGGFNDDLFIDYVDTEFGHRLRRSGRRISFLNNYSIEHEIGSPIRFSLFGRTYQAMNHSPIRYYYRYRNSLYLFKRDKTFYKKKFFKEVAVNIPKMLLFEPHKRDKIKMIRRGLRDARRGVMGPFQPDGSV